LVKLFVGLLVKLNEGVIDHDGLGVADIVADIVIDIVILELVVSDSVTLKDFV
jgi:hypothetical protein